MPGNRRNASKIPFRRALGPATVAGGEKSSLRKKKTTGRITEATTGTSLKVKCLQTNTPSLSIEKPLTHPLVINVNENLVHPLIRHLFPEKIVQAPLAGRIKFFLQNWQQVTRDQRILDIVKGWKIPLLTKPKQRRPPKPFLLSPQEKLIIDQEVQAMLRKGAICHVPHTKGEFLSNIFVTLCTFI